MNQIESLCKQAIDAMHMAYAPYSGYKVGAALLCSDGSVYTGCNIENASFSPTVCAERTAFFKAISEGEGEFKMIAVYGQKDKKGDTPFYPCGVCRQVMAEFSPDMEVLCAKAGGSYVSYPLSRLMPYTFNY